jgi:hypothetical protein
MSTVVRGLASTVMLLGGLAKRLAISLEALRRMLAMDVLHRVLHDLDVPEHY